MKIEELRDQREEILRIAHRHGVGEVRVFGSVARGEAGADSDVDLLVEVSGPTTPWFPGGLAAELQSLLHHPVDIVEPDALREPLRRQVIEEAIPL